MPSRRSSPVPDRIALGRPARIVLAAWGSVAAGACAESAADERAGRPPYEAAVDSMIAERMEADGVPGLSVAIALGGEVILAKGYGLADIEQEAPATAETAYRSASIGKPITAVAVMQLFERGLLDLDAPVQDYCDVYPAKRWPLTARHLLAHLGGVPHYDSPSTEEEVYSVTRYATVRASVAIFAGEPLLFAPGQRYHYSTFGYNLLGCAVEGASGLDYLAYLDRSVFGPAGMTGTRDDDPGAIIPGRAGGYLRTSAGELRRSRFADMSNRLPAGGFITTVRDLVRFAAAFMDGSLLHPSTVEVMLAPQMTAAGDTIGYGLGWGLFPGEEWYGEREAFHGGQTPGVSGILYLLPGRGLAVAILANVEEVEDRVGLAAQIARVVLGLDEE